MVTLAPALARRGEHQPGAEHHGATRRADRPVESDGVVKRTQYVILDFFDPRNGRHDRRRTRRQQEFFVAQFSAGGAVQLRDMFSWPHRHQRLPLPIVDVALGEIRRIAQQHLCRA